MIEEISHWPDEPINLKGGSFLPAPGSLCPEDSALSRNRFLRALKVLSWGNHVGLGRSQSPGKRSEASRSLSLQHPTPQCLWNFEMLHRILEKLPFNHLTLSRFTKF